MAEDDFFESNDNFEETDEVEETAPDLEELADKEFDSGVSQILGMEESENSESNEVTEEVEKEPALIAGMTEEELKGLLDKARQVDELQTKLTQLNDKAFGTIGQLKQELTAIKEAKREGKALTPEMFKALSEYGDDDLVNALATDLSGINLGGGSNEINWDEFNSKVDEKVSASREQLSKDFERKILTIRHPDWETLAETEDFAKWAESLSDDARKTIENSWDGMKLSQAFDSFKDWRKRKEEASEKKKQRLESAIQVGGGSGTNNTADDYFNQGLKKVVGERLG